ncbi:Pr6Pr family membrane protein [Marinimicrobium sp. ABcell2]|uniref:Pr6Pr family membrane protein n=1 Tax=Marinimicrobium sp. ABcell2 TaxID=3069751 RepID=UPI0027B69608|nr:Pr6Pr family membrane protein [Marinimicrobium sp. ABcell2]MDQ2076597.1 Pr6Pr family membrane protein [Marinimicrobium sp. ABcell2]
MNRDRNQFNFSARQSSLKAGLTKMFAALVWATLALRVYLGATVAVQEGGTALYGALASFQNFTVLTTLLIALVLTTATTSRLGRTLSGPSASTLAAVSVALVALIYHILLRNLWQPQGLWRLVDVLLHYVIPALFVVYWWCAAPKRGLTVSHLLWWPAYPLIYAAATLLRGHFTGQYPYPFFDVTTLGVGAVLLRVSGLLALFVGLSVLFLALARWQVRIPTRGR